MTSAADIEIALPDGSRRTYPRGVTIRQVAESIGRRLARDAVGGVVDGGGIIDVHTPLHASCALRIVTAKSAEGLEVLRHSTAHLMASAVQALFPGTQVTIGPAVEGGFYYDFDRAGGFTPDDLGAIEAEMAARAAQDLPFVREEVEREAALALFRGMGEHYKCELIDAIPRGETITLYRHGDWVDLCRGPHVPSTGALRAFKLTHVAGAYWRGDERNPMLARIYGTAFWDRAALDAHFAGLEEARARDHRKLGRELDLFSFHPLAPAMPFFHENGTLLYNGLLDLVRRYYRALGFAEVITPQVFDAALFHQSGHYANYRENMFVCDVDGREFAVKPMNCPGHTLLYAQAKRSYRELPLRYADFGRLHRYERSGATAGLTRVRSFCQDDAHVFCTEAQIGEEIARQIVMVQDIYRHFGFGSRVHLATRPEQSLGREEGLSAQERGEWDALWQRAEAELATAVRAAGVDFAEHRGDGAFYGPKLDFQVQDALQRWHQLGTIQLDFGLPRRFGLSYTNAQSGESRPVMIHRAVLGSLERFIGILIEHCAGDFPLWLAPVQARILTINDALLPYGRQVEAAFVAAGLRARLDARSEKVGLKIREAELQRTPVIVVVGAKEQAAGTVSLRLRKRGDQGPQPLDQAIRTVLDAAAVPGPGEALLRRMRAPAAGARDLAT